MRIISPTPNQVFTIASDTTAPVIDVHTDATGPIQWSWTISWRTFRRTGTGDTKENWVRFQPIVQNLGGTLTITARSGRQSATVTVKIVGTNPSLTELRDFTRPLQFGADLLLIAEHETHGRQFNIGRINHGLPNRSFDGGFGICQLTTPVPTYEQCWNWKENIRGGLGVYLAKRANAIGHLGRDRRTYTPDQLRRETVALYNGGYYYEWDGTAWVRPSNILCAPGTGNKGWDVDRPANKDLTLQELQERDRADFRRPHNASDDWNYFGICYADSILGP